MRTGEATAAATAGIQSQHLFDTLVKATLDGETLSPTNTTASSFIHLDKL
jgi:hypothetical protein